MPYVALLQPEKAASVFRRSIFAQLLLMLCAIPMLANAASVVSVSATPTSYTHSSGQEIVTGIDFVMTFDENVQVNFAYDPVTGGPYPTYLYTQLDSGLLVASFVAVDNATITFHAAIDNRHYDADGIVELMYVGLNRGTGFGDEQTVANNGSEIIAEASGLAADLSLEALPALTGLDIHHRSAVSVDTNGLGFAGSYEVGDTFNVYLRWRNTDDLVLSGTPQLTIAIGSRNYQLDGELFDDSLRFTHAMQDGDNGALSWTGFDLNGATFTVGETQAGDNLLVTHPLVVDESSQGQTLFTINSGIASFAVDSILPEGTGNLQQGDVLRLIMTLSAPVNLPLPEQYTLRLYDELGNTYDAAYVSGNTTNTVIFDYEVQAGDYAQNLNVETLYFFSSPTDQLDGVGGEIFKFASLTSEADLSGVAFNAVPQLTGIGGPNASTYIAGDTLTVTLNYDAAVTVEGNPTIRLRIGDQIVEAVYLSGSGSNTIRFGYQLPAGMDDEDGIEILGVNTGDGTLKDANNTQLPADFTPGLLPDLSGVLVDGGPRVTAINGPVAGTYSTGEVLNFQLVFDRVVNVNGVPQLVLEIGQRTVHAQYDAGTATDTLTFTYQLQADDNDTDGVKALYIRALTARIEDERGSIANTSLAGLAELTGILVDGDAPNGYSLSIDQALVTVDNHQQTSFTLANAEIGANYSYSVTSLDDRNGEVTGTGVITAANQQITAIDVSGLADGRLLYAITLTDGANNAGLSATDTVDKSTQSSGEPEILSVLVPKDETYGARQYMDFTLLINESVSVSGVPALLLDIGGGLQYASFQPSLSTPRELVFRYTVGSTAQDTDGIEVTELALSGGTILSDYGQPLNLTLNGLPNTQGILVDGVRPGTFYQSAFVTPTSDKLLVEGETLTIKLNAVFSTVRVVEGLTAPTLRIKLDSGEVVADYAGVSLNEIIFEYAIVAGDAHLSGNPIELVDIDYGDAAVDVNYFNVFSYALPAVLDNVADPTGPAIATGTASITGVSSQPGYYKDGNDILITVEFSKPIDVAGNPLLNLDIGGVTKTATYIPTGDATQTVTFSYSVAADDEDLDGIDVLALDANGATFVDSNTAGAADINLAETNLRGVFIDITPPSGYDFDFSDNYINSHNQLNVRLNLTQAEIGSTYEVYVADIPDVLGDLVATGDVTTSNQVVSGIDASGYTDGELYVSLILEDPTGNQGNRVSHNINKETQSPVLTLLGSDTLVVAFGDTYSDAGATAVDNQGNLTDRIQVNNPVDTSKLGTYTIEYEVQDDAGNTVIVSRTVEVTDQAAPVVTAPADIDVAAVDGSGTPATDATIANLLTLATAVDNVDGVITSISNDAPAQFPLGETTVTFSATDAAGLTGTDQAVVNVTDQAVPVITLLGNTSITISVGGVYTEPGYSAVDNVDGDIQSDVVVTGTVDTGTLGLYTLSYNVSDAAGNAAVTRTRSITINDPFAPVVTAPANIDVAAVTAAGTDAVHPDIANFLAAATAVDGVDGTLTVSNDAPATFALGTTTVTFTATDLSGNEGMAQATVTVADTTPPEITLEGDANMVVAINTSYTEPGVLAFDNVDGDLSAQVQITGSVDASTIGIYNLVYRVSDAAGNAAVDVVRRVSVQDAEAPQLQAPDSVVVAAVDANGIASDAEALEAFFAGYSVTDNIDPNPTVTHDAPGQLGLGTHLITFTAEDSTGNTSVAQSTIVVRDESAPVINLLGDARVAHIHGTQWQDPGAEATDNVDGDVTGQIVVIGAVDTETLGSYTLIYQVTDAAGNSVYVERVIDVFDGSAPVISAPTGHTVEATGAGGIDASTSQVQALIVLVTATDVVDGDVAVTSQTPTGLLSIGDHSWVFSAEDSAGNTSNITVTLTITDTTAPTILLNGDAQMQLDLGTEYQEAGVVAYDIVDGDLTAQVQVIGEVDHTQAGDYRLLYQVTDANGNEAQVLRQITVGNAAKRPSGSSDDDSGGQLPWVILVVLSSLLLRRKR